MTIVRVSYQARCTWRVTDGKKSVRENHKKTQVIAPPGALFGSGGLEREVMLWSHLEVLDFAE